MAKGRGSGTNGQGEDKPARRSVRDRAPGTSGSAAQGSGAGSTASPAGPAWRRTSTAKDGKKKGYKGQPYQEPNRFWNYPRPNKGPIHRWLPSWRFVLGSFLTVGLLGVGLFFVAYLTTDVPEPDDFALAEGSTVYFADGETPMGTFADVDREIIDPAELPGHIGEAIVASEDRRFYSNVGVDPIGILRALWNNLRGNDTQGGSTLTMQYVERYYTGQTDGYMDKFREAILALKIDQQQSKDEILGNYMNTIYFGRGAYGIERASQEFFGHSATELTLSESALIAGIIPSPGNWDPAANPDMAEARWQRTLDYMVANEYITQDEADEQTFPDVQEPSRTDVYGGSNGYLLVMIRNELLADGFTEDEIDGGGLTITSTIDESLQEHAVESAEDMPEDTPGNVRVALTSIDNVTGGILALYGGHDYLDQQRNNATQATAQGGSTFKVFGLIAALENEATLDSRFPSYSPMDVDGYTVNNFDSINRGYIDLITATKYSVNSVYVQLNQQTGPDQLVDVAQRLGLPEDTSGLDPYLSNVLGTASPHPADMAEAYSTIASGGVHHDRFIVSEVTNTDDETLYTGGDDGEREFDEEVIADATYAMQQVVQGGTGATAAEIGRPAAGKTGSSNDYRSAWFVGFVPQITTSVAMYQVGEDGEEVSMTEGWGGVAPISGGSYPTDIWTEYMSSAVEDLPVEEFPDRSAPDYTYVPPSNNDSGDDSSEEESEEPTEEPTEEESEEPTDEPTTEEPTEDPTTPDPTPTETEPGDDESADDNADGGDNSGADGGDDSGADGSDGSEADGGDGSGADGTGSGGGSAGQNASREARKVLEDLFSASG